MSALKINTARKLVQFLAQDNGATWEPTVEGGWIIHHADYDEYVSHEDLVAAAKNYPDQI